MDYSESWRSHFGFIRVWLGSVFNCRKHEKKSATTTFCCKLKQRTTARLLLRMAERRSGIGPVVPLLGLFTRHWSLEARVADILSPKREKMIRSMKMPGVVVKAQGIGHSSGFAARTTVDGDYRLEMTEDYYNIWAEAPNRMPLAIKATSGKRQRGVDIRMTRRGYVVGTVIDPADGKPINGAELNLYVAHHGPARPATGAAVSSTRVNADGSYRLHVAPGRNYVYVSGSAASVCLHVGEGKEVQHGFVIGTSQAKSRGDDPDRRLRSRLLTAAIREESERVQLREAGRAKSPNTSANPGLAIVRKNSQVGRLLDQLETMNKDRQRFTDTWAELLREIVEVGPDAVPELIDELDRNPDGMMQRCLGFMLRAIDDPRAVPALIRSIPKLLHGSGSDMGLPIEDHNYDLARFMQRHDLTKPDRKNNYYSFGRPVREVFGALRSITGRDFGEEQLYRIFADDNDTSREKTAKAKHFHTIAARWHDWWEETLERIHG